MTWVALSLTAACFQLVRNALARRLVGGISPELTSWSRFAWNLPFSASLVAVLLMRSEMPTLSPAFFAWCAGSGLSQLLANVALVSAFRRSTFSEAIALSKLDVVLGAVIGVMLFSEAPTGLGWAGIAVSTTGVLFLNAARSESADRWRHMLRLDAGAMLAVLCAALLALTGFLLKEATAEFAALNLRVGSGRFEAAAHTLFHTSWIEVLILTVSIGLRRPRDFAQIPQHWRTMLAVGATGFAGSLCWFWAYSIALVAYVRAVGQMETVLSVALSLWWFREGGVRRQLPGLAVVTIGVCLVLLG